MAAIQVNCAVSECYFWKQDNVCGADSIWVRRTGAPLRAERMDASGEFLAPARTQALTSDDTCCQTYKPRSERQS